MVYFAFGKCPLLVDDELIKSVISYPEPVFDRRYELGDGMNGLAFKLGLPFKGRLQTPSTLRNRIETENGEMDDEWNSTDGDQEQFNTDAVLCDKSLCSDDEDIAWS